MPATVELLERDEELAAIEGLLDATAAGAGAPLTVEGDAGAGKTSLLDAAAGLAGGREMLVLRARGGEYERDFPYGVVRQLFEPLLTGKDARAELLSGSAALAGPVFDAGAGVDGDPFSVQHGLYWLTVELASSAPLLLLVDDAQWADQASLRALAYIARRLDGLAACLLLTVRTGEPGEPVQLLDEIRRECGHTIEPPPLSVSAAAALVEAEVGHELTRRFAESCCEATAGNPFLLAELARAIAPEELGRGDDGIDRLGELAAAGVSRSILTRLARLGERSVEVARAVAVLEPNAELRLIAGLAGLDQEEVRESGEQLIGAGLLSDARSLSFVHPLVRAAVLTEISEPARAAVHGRAARLLDEDGFEADTVAAHLLLAEPAADDWVVGALRRAAAAALGRGAPDAAVRYLRRALREPPARGERLAVSRELGVALLRANDPEGLQILTTVRAAIADPVLRAEVAIELASSIGLRKGGEPAAVLLEESLAEVGGPTSELGLMLRGWLGLQVIWGLERIPDVLPAPGEELPLETLAGRFVQQQGALLTAFGLGSIEHGRELAEPVIADPQALFSDALEGLPPQGAVMTLVLADRGDLVTDVVSIGIDGSRRRGVLPGVAGGHGVRAICSLLDGDLRSAQADAEIAVELGHSFGFASTISIWTAIGVRTLVERGDFSAAEALLANPWVGKAHLSGSPGALLLCARGELRYTAGRHAEARHDFLAAAERLEWLPYPNPEIFPWRQGLALCEAALGNAGEAQRLAGEAVELAREAEGRRGIGISLRVQGAVVDGEEQLELLREATEVLSGTRARVQHARALVELGAALRRANRRKEARDPLREGLDIAHRCGAAHLEEMARTELQAAGARPRKVLLAGVDALTPSELRVAQMAAEGMTNREIAQALTVTPKTVETHMRHIFQKLDVGRRTELPAALEADPGS
jgi:DNA-binding NarL/FixJ family response regulator